MRALHPLAGLLGATSFMFSGLLVVWLQSVRLEPGRHEVEFRYDPGSLALSVLALLAIVALSWRPRRRPNPADES